MELSLESLETPALTKAQLAELLFEQIGLNKRESKEMSLKARTSKSLDLAIFRSEPRPKDLEEIPGLANLSPFKPEELSHFMQALN